MIANILSIAGSDTSAGAGIQADLKTISALGGYATTVLTVLTAQNTQGVHALYTLPVYFIAQQIQAIYTDITLTAIKIGAIGSHAIATCVAEQLTHFPGIPIVLDPVLVATSGDSLSVDGMPYTALFPKTTLITPNLQEAATLLGTTLASNIKAMKQAAEGLYALSGAEVLITGGHLSGAQSVDVYFDGQQYTEFTAPKITTLNTHGSGCTLSSAIATLLGQGYPMHTAIAKAKAYVSASIQAAHQLQVGQGTGPLNHFHALS